MTAGLEIAPAAGQSGAFTSWSVDDSPSKGWFNDAGEPGKAPLLSTIDQALTDAGIDSNIGELENPSATPPIGRAVMETLCILKKPARENCFYR